MDDLQVSRPVSRPGFFLPEDLQVSRPLFSLPEDLQVSRPEDLKVSRPGFFLPEDLQVSRPMFSLPEDLQVSRLEGRPVSRPGFILPEDLQVSRPMFSLQEDLQVSRPEGRPVSRPVFSLCIKNLCYKLICVNFFVKLHYQTNIRRSCPLYYPKGYKRSLHRRLFRLLIVKSSNIPNDLTVSLLCIRYVTK